ncbi:MAG: OmpH family outer membrane protein [Pseudomonadota bacterium]
MNKLFKAVIVSAALLIIYGGAVLGADSVKIGVVDLQDIIEKSEFGKAASEKIKTKGNELSKELKQKSSEVKKMEEQFEKNTVVLSKDARKEQEDKLHAKINDLKTLEREYSRVLKELNNELLQQLEKKIKEVIGDLAKKEKYTLVLTKQPAVAYSVPGLDITNTVISMLDSRSKKPEADK